MTNDMARRLSFLSIHRPNREDENTATSGVPKQTMFIKVPALSPKEADIAGPITKHIRPQPEAQPMTACSRKVQ